MNKQVGTSPVNLLFERSTIRMLLMLHNDGGRYPEMILLEATRTSKFGNTELMLVGSCPTKWLLEMLIISRADWWCHIGSIDPTNELLAMFR